MLLGEVCVLVVVGCFLMVELEAKVSSCKIGIPGSEMRSLIICRGIRADEKDTLNKKTMRRVSPAVRLDAALSCELLIRFSDRLVYSRD